VGLQRIPQRPQDPGGLDFRRWVCDQSAFLFGWEKQQFGPKFGLFFGEATSDCALRATLSSVLARPGNPKPEIFGNLLSTGWHEKNGGPSTVISVTVAERTAGPGLAWDGKAKRLWMVGRGPNPDETRAFTSRPARDFFVQRQSETTNIGKTEASSHGVRGSPIIGGERRRWFGKRRQRRRPRYFIYMGHSNAGVATANFEDYPGRGAEPTAIASYLRGFFEAAPGLRVGGRHRTPISQLWTAELYLSFDPKVF